MNTDIEKPSETVPHALDTNRYSPQTKYFHMRFQANHGRYLEQTYSALLTGISLLLWVSHWPREDIYIYFIDYTKAFDRVKHSKIIECLSEIGIDDKELNIITKMYGEQTAVVRNEQGITEEFQIKKGVRQGCV